MSKPDTDLSATFIALLHQHQGIIHKVCTMYTRSSEDRADLFQEISLQAWRAFPQYRAEARFSTWLYRVALNVAISTLRYRQRRPQTQTWDESYGQLSEKVSTPAADPPHLLYHAIGTLSDVEKGIIMLNMEGYAFEEIGKIVGITPNHVGVKLNRIKTKLRKRLADPPSSPSNKPH